MAVLTLTIWIIILVVLVFAIGLLLRAVGSVARIVVSLLLIALVLAGGGWVMMDVNDLRQHFYQDDKLFVLDIDGRLAGAFVLGGDGLTKPVTDLRPLRAAYPDLAAIQGDAYKVIVLTWPVVAGDLQLEGFSAARDELRAALVSDNPKQLFIDKAIVEYGPQALGQIKLQADTLYPTHDAFASTLFALLAEKPLANPDLMFRGLKAGTVRVWPETVTFKILKVLPEGFHKLLVPQ